MTATDPKRTLTSGQIVDMRIMKLRNSRYVPLALLAIAAGLFSNSSISADETEKCAQEGVAKLAISSMALFNAREDLRLWRELELQEIDNTAVKQIIANNLIRYVVTVGAAKVDVNDLKGASLEALCLLTTDEVKGIVEQFGHEGLAVVSLAYIDEIQDNVVARVREVQKSLLGTGCGLSPGRAHF